MEWLSSIALLSVCIEILDHLFTYLSDYVFFTKSNSSFLTLYTDNNDMVRYKYFIFDHTAVSQVLMKGL